MSDGATMGGARRAYLAARITEREAAREGQANAWIQFLAQVVVFGTFLYLLVGNTPYEHVTMFDPLSQGAEQISPVNRYIWLSLLGLSLPILWFRLGQVFELCKRIWPLLLLYGWFIVTLSWALDPAAAQRRIFLYVVSLLICMAASSGLKDGRRMLGAIAAACAVMTAIDVFSWLVLPSSMSMTELGLAGIHSHKNTQGSVAMFCSFVCGAYALAGRDVRHRLFWWATSAAAAAVLVASRSKTSLGILFAIALAAPLLVAVLNARRKVMVAAIAAALVVPAAAAFLWIAYAYATGGDPFAFIGQITFTGRADVWKFVWDEACKHPFTGVGFGSFWDIDPALQPSLKTDYWFAQPDAPTNEAHDGYLDLLVTTGAVGLTLAVAVLLRWVFKAAIMWREALLNLGNTEPGYAAYAGFLSIFTGMMLFHNFLESSYFTANATFGSVILFVGIEIDRRWPEWVGR